MAATVRASIATGAGPTLASAEGGAKYNREDSLAGTSSPIPRPTATGTAFSYRKTFCLEVTGTDTTSISNRKIHFAAGITTGLAMWYIDLGDTYTQAAAAADTDSGSNGATPSGYTAMPTSATLFDSGSDVTSGAGRSGDYVGVALGVSNNYAGGAGSAISLPTLTLTYDES
jgi:hypothetical protein